MGIYQKLLLTVAFLGWNPGDQKELLSMEELCENFTLERVGKSGAKFDFDKTRWFNQQYLRKKSSKELVKELQIILKTKEIEAEDAFVEEVCKQLKERATFVNDMWIEGKYFFQLPLSYDEKVIQKKWRPDTPILLEELKNRIMAITDFTSKNVELVFKSYLQEKELSMGRLLPVFRVALTGVGMGPSLFDIATLLGKKETIKRIETVLEKIN